jgi:hypothetical protein
MVNGNGAGDFRPDLNVMLTYQFIRFIRDMLSSAARRYSSGRPGPRADSAQVAETGRSLILSGLLR